MPKSKTATGSCLIWIDNRNTGAVRIYTAYKTNRLATVFGESLKRPKFLALARLIATLATPFTHRALDFGVGCEGCALVRQPKAIDLWPGQDHSLKR